MKEVFILGKDLTNGEDTLVQNRFPFHMYDVVVSKRDNKELVLFLPSKDAEEYWFFIQYKDLLNERLKNKCRSLSFPKERLEEAVEGIWKHISEIEEDIDFYYFGEKDPHEYLEFKDEYHILCPRCKEQININSKDENGEYIHSCHICHLELKDEINKVTHIKECNWGGQIHYEKRRTYWKWQKRLQKREEIKLQERGFYDIENKPMDIYTFGQELKRIRKAKGLTQRDIKGISPKTISKIENAKKYDFSALKKYIKKLDVKLFLNRKNRAGWNTWEPLEEYYIGNNLPDIFSDCDTPRMFFRLLLEEEIEPILSIND